MAPCDQVRTSRRASLWRRHHRICKTLRLCISMRSMRSMRGGFIFRNRGPSLKVHHGQHFASMTKHDSRNACLVLGNQRLQNLRVFLNSDIFVVSYLFFKFLLIESLRPWDTENR
jgi:hypothetical protein